MALTYPAAFLGQNGNAASADAGASITASSSLPLCPPSNLQTEQMGQAWCAETDTAYLTIALAAATTIDIIGLFGLNLTAAAITRVRASLTDTSAQDGAVYDSGSAAGRVSAYYGNLVVLLNTSASARYIRIDLSESGIARILAGFVMVGLKNQVTINYAPGAADTPVDPSIKTRSRSQAVHIDPRAKYRKWNLTFEWLSETAALGWVEDLDQLCGVSKNVMVVRNCASTDLGRDTLCGLMTQGAPTISRDGFIDGANARSKTYEIETRV